MPKKVPFNGTVFLRLDEEDAATLREIDKTHQIAPTKFTAALIKSACQFYREKGWFSFPIVIEPEAFQARYVAEEQAIYEQAKKEEAKEKKKKP
jgi:hypothetical protein